MLNDPKLLKALLNFQVQSVKEKQIMKVKDLLNKEKDVFEGEELKKVSKAGYGLLRWVRAVGDLYEEQQPQQETGPSRTLGDGKNAELL